MKNVEIITTQNVVLQYELASLQDRVFAFLIDFFCLVLGLTILSGILAGMAAGSETGATLVVFLTSTVFILYSLVLETFNNGQSIGKKAMKIRVIKLEGANATFSDYAARWAFRMIDIYFSLGSLAAILILTSSKGQRIGDIIANTAIVKTVPRTNIDLDDLLSIHQANKHAPKYLQARKLREEDALLIKVALERYRRLKNRGHKEAIASLANHIRQTLSIDQVDETDPLFLKTILTDYVVLSR